MGKYPGFLPSSPASWRGSEESSLGLASGSEVGVTGVSSPVRSLFAVTFQTNPYLVTGWEGGRRLAAGGGYTGKRVSKICGP